MMKAVRPYNPLRVGTLVGVGHAGGPNRPNGANGEKVHGSGEPLDHNQGQGLVSDPSLRPYDASRQSRQAKRPLQNADIPPVTFPGGKNPYLDRPLPPPPPSKNITTIPPPIMLERPSTSSGPDPSKSAGTRPDFSKRMSKDDLALMGMTSGKGNRLQPYITNVKGPGLLSPEHSPRRRMPSPSPISSLPARVLTPESLTSGEIQIGMALGSPARDSSSPYAGSPYVSSPYTGWQPQTKTSIQSSYSPSPVQPTPEPPLQRTKTQRRRLFGLFGSRKNSGTTKTMEAVEANRSATSVAASASTENITPARGNTIRKTPKHKPIVIKQMPEPQAEPAIQESKMQQRADDWPTIVEPVPSLSMGGSGLLDVEIPDIRLERYSVMFSGVLNPNGTKSSLLERRQATLEKLKTISDKVADEEEGRDQTRPRRSTSPHPMRSPSFTLFPPTPGRHSGIVGTVGAAMSSTTSLVPPRGLTRSNTSPAHLPSPSRANFEHRHQHGSAEQTLKKEKKSVTIVSPRTMDERNRAAQVEKLREQQQALQAQQYRSRDQPTTTTTITTTTTTFHFGPNESSLILDSPDSISSSEDESYRAEPTTKPLKPSSRALTRSVNGPLKPTLHEPQWQMISPPSSTSTTSSTSTSATSATSAASATSASITKRSASSSISSTSTAASTSRPSFDSSIPATLDNMMPRVSVVEEDAALKAAVEISIARQISVSRQQRKMLQMRGTTAGGGGAGMGAGMGRGRSATFEVGMTKREEVTVGVVKGRVTPVTTTVVVPGPGGGRRSERVVLDVVE